MILIQLFSRPRKPRKGGFYEDEHPPEDAVDLPLNTVLSLHLEKKAPSLYEDSVVFLENLREARETAYEWGLEYGPVANWPALFLSKDQGVSSQQACVLRINVTQKIEGGRAILHSIRGLFRWLPNNALTVKSLWIQAFDVSAEVLAGMSALETRAVYLETLCAVV